MSTIGYKDWAVDLAEVGAVYPLQGWEVAMTIVGVIFWLVWHRIQFVREGEHLEKAKKMGDQDKVKKALERY
ncbi:hypothetical protein MUY35_00080 [Aliiroseovarius sp. S1339]|uniref:hypothetical protein n=1 Tax=Aliiroseovarius sp. S1339 TaxID=2936990 RepID=UPI0020C11DAA|nr:hypothetical protein [Aliiroseovarius sp. S1339]MCK8462242.1 hypothetical protein [Aliiroseovarius sp. S1339]